MFKSKVFVSALASGMVLSGFTNVAHGETNVAHGEMNEVEIKQLNQKVENVLDSIGEDISVTNKGIDYDKKELALSINDDQIEELNSLAKIQGINTSYTKESFLKKMTDGLDEVNQKVEDGDLKVLSDGTMIESDDENFYLQGGSTRTTTHYWGKRYYKSTKATKDWIYRGEQNAVGLGSAAAVSAFFTVGAGFALGTATSTWFTLFTRSLKHYNNKRGTVSDITWVLVYSVKSQ